MTAKNDLIEELLRECDRKIKYANKQIDAEHLANDYGRLYQYSTEKMEDLYRELGETK